MDQTNPSEAAAASSHLPDERTLQDMARNDSGFYMSLTQAMAREILRMRRDCPPTAEVEKLREAARSANLLRLQLSKVEGERDDLRLIAERNVGEMAKMASERVDLQREVERLRAEKKSETAMAIEHLRKAGVIVGSPMSGPTPGVKIGEPMTLAGTVGMLCDERAKILAGLGREAKALLEASFMLRCAAGRHPMPSPRVEETFGIFEALRKLCDERDTAMHEADAWKHKADTLGADLNRIRSLVPTASDEQTTFDAVQAYLAKVHKERDAASKALFDVAIALERADGGASGTYENGPPRIRALARDRDEWKAAADERGAVLGRLHSILFCTFPASPTMEEQAKAMVAAANNGAPPVVGYDHLFMAHRPGAWSTEADEFFVYRRVGATPWVTVHWRHGPGVSNKQQDLLDQIAQLLPGKGDLLGRVQKGAALAKIGAEASNDGWRERFMRLRDSIKVQLAWCSTPSGTPHPGMLAEHRVLSCALKNAEAMLREASGDLASLPSLPAKEGPLPGSFCGTNQPEMPPLKADAPCGYKPASHRDDFDNAPNFGGKFAPATGQPRTEAPLAADGSGTVVELGEAFRTAMINASVLTMADILPGESIEAAKLRHLRHAVAELAKVVERIGVR